MVYPLELKLMDVNWINQELGRIPLFIEETYNGNQITRVRVEPTGDIRLPHMGKYGDKALRWSVVSCNASRADAPYTLKLNLDLVQYAGKSTQQHTRGDVVTTFDYGIAPASTYNAILEVQRHADATFTFKILHDNISKLTDVEPHHYLQQPAFWQQSLDLQLELPKNQP